MRGTRNLSPEMVINMRIMNVLSLIQQIGPYASKAQE
ncbi:hypothetical protein M8C21_015592 [Ambrosia artemisiifolia]|uniref:Uncharacterized protein n=1 Tax=Ambrosia artemisiifolia TaxID=4212 RepID=A0AAD5CYK0_AMBAR|nr:hypothetical protein M8C21_015592 [Ambrosia artemisiifolia]